MDLITVIVPVYNAEKYLPQCVSSVLGQSYPALELILVDDGSPDLSGAICDEYANTDSRVRTIHQENRGLSGARNSGLDAATGAALFFLDADDWLADHALENLLTAMRFQNADMAVGSFQMVDHSGGFLSEKCLLPFDVLSGRQALSQLHDNVALRMACNKLYSKNLWQTQRFPEGRLHEDEAVAHHILFACDRVATIPDISYYYRQTPGSIINTESPGRAVDRLSALGERVYFLLENKMLQEASEFQADWWYYFSNFFPTLQHNRNQEKTISASLHAQFKAWFPALLSNAALQGQQDQLLMRLLYHLPGPACALIRLRRKITGASI